MRVHDLRDWSDDPLHHTIDDTPFGGGGGMILKAEPIARAVEVLGGGPMLSRGATIIPTPHGASSIRTMPTVSRPQVAHLMFVCGHYTGMDERVFEYLHPDRRCVGDDVLSGDELPTYGDDRGDCAPCAGIPGQRGIPRATIHSCAAI